MSIKMFAIGLSTCLTMPLRSAASLPSPAIGDHGQSTGNQQKPHSGELVQAVRESTRRFRNVDQAKAEGYQLLFGCVSGPDDGAMGLALREPGAGRRRHTRPEPSRDCHLRAAAERRAPPHRRGLSRVRRDWHASNTATPELGGQLMHLIESPNRYGLPAFYTLHVWAWKPNPTGAFVNWHSDVSCEQFDGQAK